MRRSIILSRVSLTLFFPSPFSLLSHLDSFSSQPFVASSRFLRLPVILAISSSNRDPMNAMAKLYDRLNQSKFYGQRPFMDPSVLRYFVVVHDVGGGVDLEE